nr:hypothetical protein [Bacilli bacterium]
MKCKFCGYDISDTDTLCPGCNKDVAELKKSGNVIYTEEPEAEILATPVEDEVKETLDTPQVPEVKDEPISKETVEEVVEPVVIKDKFKKKSGLKGFIICLLIILLLVAGGFSYMYFIYTNPAKVTKKMYSDLLTNLPINKGNTINVDYTDSKLEGYTFNTINYISGSDIISNINVTGNEVMLNINALKNNDGIYFYESNLYDKYVKLNEDTLPSKESFKLLNVVLHRNEFVNIIKNTKLDTYINSNELTKEFTTITYNQKNMGTTKFSYSNTKANGVVSKYLIAIRDNNANLESIAKILNMTMEDAVNKINELITEINNDAYEIGFDLYTDYLTKSYYKLDINVKNNSHSLVINIEFNDNKVKDIKVTYDETYIYITNNMENININNGDNNITFVCKYTNDTLPYPVLDEAVLYEDVSTIIDTNISNNDAIKRLQDAINGNVIVDDILPESDELIDQITPELPSSDLIPDAPIDNVNE